MSTDTNKILKKIISDIKSKMICCNVYEVSGGECNRLFDYKHPHFICFWASHCVHIINEYLNDETCTCNEERLYRFKDDPEMVYVDLDYVLRLKHTHKKDITLEVQQISKYQDGSQIISPWEMLLVKD